MIVRAYSDRVGSVDKWSSERKRELMLLERKNLDRVVIRDDLKLLTLQSKDQKQESFQYDGCVIEIFEKSGEINVGI